MNYIDDNNFNSEVLNSDIPVLVDFYTASCIPCKMVSPIVEQLSIEYDGKIKIVKIEASENVNTSTRFNVTGVPTFILFKNGEELNRMVGMKNKSELEGFIANV